jgi:heme-degrading monooxygenase HmoA
MHARLVTFQGSPDRMQAEAGQRFRERVLPTLQQQAGFKGAYVLLNREQGKLLGLTLWESEQAARAGMQAMEPIRTASAQEMGVPSVAPEGYEVVYST